MLAILAEFARQETRIHVPSARNHPAVVERHKNETGNESEQDEEGNNEEADEDGEDEEEIETRIVVMSAYVGVVVEALDRRDATRTRCERFCGTFGVS